MDKNQMERALKERQTEILASLYEKYDLTPLDVFQHKHYQIIKREGIEKIMDIEDIYYDLSIASSDEVSCTIMGKYWTVDADGNQSKVVTTTGSANRGTSQSAYFAEMAEKRCNSRGTLKLIKAYQHGFFGEDEFDTDDEDFRRSRGQVASGGTRAVFKG